MKTKSFMLWLVAVGPIGLLLAGFAYGAWRDYRAWVDVKRTISEVNRSQSATTPINFQPLADTAANAERLMVVNELNDFTGALSRQSQWQEILLTKPIDSETSDEKLDDIKQLLDAAEPTIVKLDSLLQSEQDKRVDWVLYQSSKQLLETNFYYSCHIDDSEKALRALRLLARTAGSPDPNLSVSAQRGYFDEQHRCYRLFADSLKQVSWNAAELDELSTLLLQPLDIPQRLLAGHQQRLPDTVASIISQYQHYFRVDWTKEVRWSSAIDPIYLKSLLEAAKQEQAIVKVADLPKSIGMTSRQPHFARGGVFSLRSNVARDHWMPGVQSEAHHAYTLGIMEDTRRALGMAVAVKQFEIDQHRWPKSLDELPASRPGAQLNLTTVDNQPFGYYLGTSPNLGGASMGLGFADAADFEMLTVDPSEPIVPPIQNPPVGDMPIFANVVNVSSFGATNWFGGHDGWPVSYITIAKD